MSTPPPIVYDAQHLPHCAACVAEGETCAFHRRQVTAALNALVTPTVLSRAQHDVRYLVTSRRLGRRADADTA